MNCIEKNISKLNVAVGAAYGRVAMGMGDNSGMHFVIPGNEVYMIQLPDFGGLDFLKVDVEGFEYYVLLGALTLLDKYNPIVIFENKASVQARYQESVNPVAFMESLGYKTAAISRSDIIMVR